MTETEQQEKDEQETSPVSGLLKTLKENSEAIHIGRVPIQTKRDFIQLANEEFCSDYGMTLKFLMDGIPKQDIVEILERLTALEDKINTITANPTEEVKKEIKLVNGKVLKRK